LHSRSLYSQFLPLKTVKNQQKKQSKKSFTVQPTQLGEFGFRYGLQLAQLFGVDFGFGLLKSTCTIDFVRV
jgi:hypothetical protein